MKTVIVFKDKETNEKICQIFEYQTKKEKKWLVENFVNKEDIIYESNIDGLSYLQHRKDHNV